MVNLGGYLILVQVAYLFPTVESQKQTKTVNGHLGCQSSVPVLLAATKPAQRRCHETMHVEHVYKLSCRGHSGALMPGAREADKEWAGG